MINYKIIDNDVVETQTGYIISSHSTKDQAKVVCRHLNFGGGFDGYTPQFFLQKIKNNFVEDESFV